LILVILPVENVVLVTLESDHQIKQVLLEFKIDEDEFEAVFMISPQLNNDIILGYQLLREYGIDINFGKNTISYFKNGIQRRITVTRQNTNENKTTNSLETLNLTNVQESESESEWDKFKLLPIMNNIEEEKRLKIYDILEKYKDYMVTKPGKCNLFTYKFLVETDKPIIGYSRPIPFSIR
jgi:hypothetical protein